MEAIYSNTYIRYIVRAFVAFFSAMLLSAILFSSLGYIDGAQAETDEVDVQVNVAPVLDLRVEKSGSVINELDLSVTPTSAGAFVKDDLDVVVNTSNPTGYTLTIADKDTDTAMHNTVATITDTISSLAATATDTTFPANTWGYSIESIASTQNFSPIPLSTAADTIKTTDAAATEDITPVTFGVNVDSTLSAGTYQDTVVFSAVTNYVPRGLETITTMQDMTPDICAATPTPAVTDTNVPQSTLSDTRDGKTYVVRKLADGNCWMVQNLDLDLSTSVALNSDTSDLSPGRTWTPQYNTQTTAGTAWAQNGGNVARSMDPGDIYFPNGVGTGTADAYGNLQGATTGQPWEHIGNYYNWYAATAGAGTAAMASGNATDSICPKGWKLPDNSGTKSFLNLVTTTYGLQNDNAADSTKILQAPLSFVRSGSYNFQNGQPSNKGVWGHWRSATATSAINATYLSAGNARIFPQDPNAKGYGISIRCVAR